MNDIHNTQSTTEELIVAYLDGELVRKELEIELFDRLATAPEARTILREHLVMRGAIKQSLTDDRFALSDDLDMRTRARLEQILKSSPGVAAPITKRMPDAPLVTHNAAERRLQQWSKRPVALALLLLLAVGSTWYLTRASIEGQHAGPSVASNTNTPETIKPEVKPAEQVAPSNAGEQPAVNTASSNVQQPKVIVRNVIRYVERPSRDMAHSNSNAASQSVQNTTPATDPAGIMLSRRAARALQNSKTIDITEQDRI